ncbi:cyclin-dependent kinase 20-like [Diorhabda sublineata]|uniref:cyclin-dependent kinase 20-like n=1 Tax=Diorhabda sublineata TaxID=1163346 RepID=UPI0024E0E457|nr:cyclin-dependent kinase 20-like [Diorhabda sublineata]
MNNYKILGRAGEGAYGFVFKGVDLRTANLAALKKINVNQVGCPKSVIREILALRFLRHKNIVKLLDFISLKTCMVLVMEYLPTTLYDILSKNDLVLSLGQVKAYTRMLLKGVNYMHQNHIMHRDLKPANLLLSKNGILKIGDFGLARIYDHEKRRLYSHQVATRWYRSPELLYGSRTYNLSVDMWSVGCIIAEMVEGKPLFPGETDIEQLAMVLGTLGTPNNKTWPGLTQLPDYNKISFTYAKPQPWTSVLPEADSGTIDLISKILIYDQNKRLTAKEALNDRYFKQYPLPCKLSQMPKIDEIETNESPCDFSEFDIYETSNEDSL